MQVLFQSHELKRVHGREPRPVTLVVARFAAARASYALYEVTRDERLPGLESLVELGAMSFAAPPVLVSVPARQVARSCAERGWYLLYKEGDRPHRYTADLTQRLGEGEALQTRATGEVLAASAAEAYQRAVRVLLRDYPREEHYSRHDGVRVENQG